MRFKRLNEICDKWADFADCYMVCDEGFICRVEVGSVKILKSGYYRDKEKYRYQQVRSTFGTQKQHTVKVHVAVALAFIPRVPGKDFVNHIDGDASNNHVDNLEWISHTDNIRQRKRWKQVWIRE